MRGLWREVRTKEGDKDSGRTVKKKSQARDRCEGRKRPWDGVPYSRTGLRVVIGSSQIKLVSIVTWKNQF